MAVELVFAMLIMSSAPSVPDTLDIPTDAMGTLVFQIAGLKNVEGKVVVKLYDSERSFLEEAYLVQSVVPSSTGEITITFNKLPYGKYGASVFHDKNDNDKLDRGWMGIPKEPYAFSNNAKGRRGPASYKDAKFIFSEKSNIQRIYLGRYKLPRPTNS